MASRVPVSTVTREVPTIISVTSDGIVIPSETETEVVSTIFSISSDSSTTSTSSDSSTTASDSSTTDSDSVTSTSSDSSSSDSSSSSSSSSSIFSPTISTPPPISTSSREITSTDRVTPSRSSSEPSSSSTSDASGSGGSSTSLSTGAIAGIAVGGAVVLVVAALLLRWCLCSRNRHRGTDGLDEKYDDGGGRNNGGDDDDGGRKILGDFFSPSGSGTAAAAGAGAFAGAAARKRGSRRISKQGKSTDLQDRSSRRHRSPEALPTRENTFKAVPYDRYEAGQQPRTSGGFAGNQQRHQSTSPPPDPRGYYPPNNQTPLPPSQQYQDYGYPPDRSGTRTPASTHSAGIAGVGAYGRSMDPQQQHQQPQSWQQQQPNHVPIAHPPAPYPGADYGQQQPPAPRAVPPRLPSPGFPPNPRRESQGPPPANRLEAELPPLPPDGRNGRNQTIASGRPVSGSPLRNPVMPENQQGDEDVEDRRYTGSQFPTFHNLTFHRGDLREMPSRTTDLPTQSTLTAAAPAEGHGQDSYNGSAFSVPNLTHVPRASGSGNNSGFSTQQQEQQQGPLTVRNNLPADQESTAPPSYRSGRR